MLPWHAHPVPGVCGIWWSVARRRTGVESRESREEVAQPRKPYVPPQLTVCGDVREITQSQVGSKGDDGATIGNKKTS